MPKLTNSQVGNCDLGQEKYIIRIIKLIIIVKL